MIENDAQLQITKNRSKSFSEAMLIALKLETETDPIKRQLYIDAHQAMIEKFANEIAEYQALINLEIDYLHENIL